MNKVDLSTYNFAECKGLIFIDNFNADRTKWVEQWLVLQIKGFVEALRNSLREISERGLKVKSGFLERFIIGVKGRALI